MIKEKNNLIAKTFKKLRKDYGITQENFAMSTGLGLRFIRELEQGKTTVRLDKVNEAFAAFGYELVPSKIKGDR